jgi:arylsulfatase A-like enzyme
MTSHAVPAIAWWPGHIESGQVTDQLAISLDVFPTILDVAGIKSPAGHLLDGRSLLPVLTKGASLEERTLFWQHGNQLAMRRGPWKLVHNAPGLEDEGTGEQGKVGLYNLQNDISESGNQAADHPNRVKTMLQALRTWEDEVTKNATPQP